MFPVCFLYVFEALQTILKCSFQLVRVRFSNIFTSTLHLSEYCLFQMSHIRGYIVISKVWIFLFCFLDFLLKILCMYVCMYVCREKGREGERERNINVWLPFPCPQLGTWPATQECALTGNRTSNPLVCRPMLNPLSYTSQACFFGFFYNPF